MAYVIHYYNDKTNRLACNQRVGMSFRGHGSARMWTQDKTKVTCTKCLNQITKWEARNSHTEEREMEESLAKAIEMLIDWYQEYGLSARDSRDQDEVDWRMEQLINAYPQRDEEDGERGMVRRREDNVCG